MTDSISTSATRRGRRECRLHFNFSRAAARPAPVGSRQAADRRVLATDDQLLADCDVETFRAGGPGGQHQNKTESAVRLRHRPSGIVVTARQSRSQHRNRQAALAELRRRLELLSRPDTPRTLTKPTRASRERRAEAKRRQSRRKAERRWRPDGTD